MKTRQGFVSNSSTTSFTVYGISLDQSTVNSELRDTIEGALYDAQKAGKFKNLDTHYGEEGYYFYFGRNTPVQDGSRGRDRGLLARIPHRPQAAV